jgi:hypothetical protein
VNEAAMGEMIQASLKAGGLDVDGDDMSEAVAYMQQVCLLPHTFEIFMTCMTHR